MKIIEHNPYGDAEIERLMKHSARMQDAYGDKNPNLKSIVVDTWTMVCREHSERFQQLEARDSQVIAEFIRRVLDKIDDYRRGDAEAVMQAVAKEMAAPSKEVCCPCGANFNATNPTVKCGCYPEGTF